MKKSTKCEIYRTDHRVSAFCLLLLCFTLPLLPQLGNAQTEPTASLPSSEHSYRLVFKNGDSMHAKRLSTSNKSDDSISIESRYLLETADFSISQLKSIELQLAAQPNSKFSPEHLATITISVANPKDELLKITERIEGQIIKLDENYVTLKTHFATNLTIPRTEIQDIEIEDQTGILFKSPRSIGNWRVHDQANPSWKIQHQQFISTKQQCEISKDIKLPDLAHISFEVEHQKTRRFYLYFYAAQNADDDEEKTNYYQFVTQTGTHFIQRVTNGVIHPLQRKIDRNAPRIRSSRRKKLSYDLYLDRENGQFHIYIDGNFYRSFHDENPQTATLGTSIHLVSKSAPHIISNFKVRSWSGALNMSTQLEQDDTDITPNQIKLHNGDSITGTTNSIKSEAIMVETQFGLLTVPLKGVSKIHSSTDKKTTPLKLTNTHIKASFLNEDFIILKLNSIKGYQLNASHRIFGENTYDLRAFSKIEFNLQ